MTLRFRRDRAPGCCSYRPAMRSCIGRRRARRCSSKAPLHRYGCRGGCDACGLHRQAASGWHSAKTMSLSRRHDRHQCWDQPRRQGGGVQRPWAATWAPRPLHQIFMRLGVWACRWQPKCGLQNGVEPRARDRASAGGGPGSVDVERVVCGRRLSSARPRDGAKRAPAAVARWMIH